jgi:hypothetical protein
MAKKSLSPEKNVEAQIVPWLKMKGFFCHVVESKATYSKNRGCYFRGNAPVGFPDIVGIGPYGEPVFIELKAPGKTKTLRAEQREFLLEVIHRGGFGICVDSCELLAEAYKEWISSGRSKSMMLFYLPKKRDAKIPSRLKLSSL